MKIIIVNGSPRKSGATAAILKKIVQELQEKKSFGIEYINISDMDIAFCNGCSQCFKTGECFIQDDAEALSQRIAKCDGLIIGSPTYESEISGQLKTLLDRGHFVMEQLLAKKTTMSVVVGENYGMKGATKTLKNLFLFSGAFTSSKIETKLPFSKAYALTPHLEKEIVRKTNKFYRDVTSKKSFHWDSVLHFFIFTFGIKSFVLSKGDKYTGVKRHWENA